MLMRMKLKNSDVCQVLLMKAVLSAEIDCLVLDKGTMNNLDFFPSFKLYQIEKFLFLEK